MRRSFKSIFSIALLLLLAITPKIAHSAGDEEKGKDYLLNYLEQTRQAFNKSVDGMSEAQWKFKPAPDRWSPAEVAEHITLAEDYINGLIQGKIMTSPAATPEQKKACWGKEEKVIAGVTDRSHKAQAPEPIKPSGKWSTREDLMKEFNARRDKTEAWVKATPLEDLRAHVFTSPTPLGDMDAYQWTLFLAGHSSRHTAQIEEDKADPGYPKK